MTIRRHTNEYNFIADASSGITFRWGKTLDEDPLRAPWPELADISISNHCSNNCSYCYRNSSSNNSFMSINDYAFVLEQLTHPAHGNVFQVALGGGEPLEHPDFLKIMNLTRQHGVIANFTTNGQQLSESLIDSFREDTGAVAVSVTSFDAHTLSKLKMLVNCGVRTNIHFIIAGDTIGIASTLLQGNYDDLLQGINAIVFLTYKSAGRADPGRCIRQGAELDNFLGLVSSPKTALRFGFDACMVPLLLYRTSTMPEFVDSCECAFFSVYIDEKLNVKPCSFSNESDSTFNLRAYPFQYIWDTGFEPYRKQMLQKACTLDCHNSTHCRGNCIFFPELTLCSPALQRRNT